MHLQWSAVLADRRWVSTGDLRWENVSISDETCITDRPLMRIGLEYCVFFLALLQQGP